MLGLGIAEIVIIYLFVAICLGVVIAWILKSEATRNVCRIEIKKLRSHIEQIERERYLLSEKMDSLKDSIDEAGEGAREGSVDNRLLKEIVKKNELLQKENLKLKSDLGEAMTSLEEVYKALCK